MKIISVRISGLRNGLSLSEMKLGKVTLLVGSSGVGKTRILEEIYSLKRILIGETQELFGMNWDVKFTVLNGDEEIEYNWGGSFSANQEGRLKPDIIDEFLDINGNRLFLRSSESFVFDETLMPKIAKDKSVIEIFSEDERIKPAFLGLMQIHYMTYEGESRPVVSYNWINSVKNNIKTEDELINSDFSVYQKMALAYALGFNIFEEIKQDYDDIFEQIIDLKFVANKEDDSYFLCLVESSGDVVSQSKISSGMYKTLIYIAEMKLLKNSSLVLIDEFENSLGINCIYVVADIIKNDDRNMQFVITSHHPYIINNIDIANWRIVTRQGTVITTKTADELNLGKSRHEVFKQLINLKEYTDGIK